MSASYIVAQYRVFQLPSLQLLCSLAHQSLCHCWKSSTILPAFLCALKMRSSTLAWNTVTWWPISVVVWSAAFSASSWVLVLGRWCGMIVEWFFCALTIWSSTLAWNTVTWWPISVVVWSAAFSASSWILVLGRWCGMILEWFFCALKMRSSTLAWNTVASSCFLSLSVFTQHCLLLLTTALLCWSKPAINHH